VTIGVVLVPDSVVYHEGGQTVQEMSSEIKFHGVKNTLILQLTNFEFNLAVKSLFITSFLFLFKKYFGDSTIKNNELFFSPPSTKIAMKGIWWVLKNFSYVLKKRKHVNSRRKKSTSDLISMNLIR